MEFEWMFYQLYCLQKGRIRCADCTRQLFSKFLHIFLVVQESNLKIKTSFEDYKSNRPVHINMGINYSVKISLRMLDIISNYLLIMWKFTGCIFYSTRWLTFSFSSDIHFKLMNENQTPIFEPDLFTLLGENRQKRWLERVLSALFWCHCLLPTSDQSFNSLFSKMLASNLQNYENYLGVRWKSHFQNQHDNHIS